MGVKDNSVLLHFTLHFNIFILEIKTLIQLLHFCFPVLYLCFLLIHILNLELIRKVGAKTFFVTFRLHLQTFPP